jgi:hypothetical protein
MACYVDSIDLPVSVEEAFDYLADFSRTAEWDPGVVEAARLTPDTPALGSRFRVVVAFLGRRFPLEYAITAFERPHRLVLEGGDDALRSFDEMRFESRRGGSRVHYDARLELTGLRRLADPLLHVLFQRMGRLAARGLRERLARPRRRRPQGKQARRASDGRAPERDPEREGVVQ